MLIACSACPRQWTVLDITAKRNFANHDGKYLCRSCAARAATKPQNNSSFWTEEKRRQHGERMRGSEKYYAAIQQRDTSGAKNPMFGKKASLETRMKMSASRIGKTGPSATAWKGGRGSINRKVRHIIHTRWNWYLRVYRRDKFACVKCGSKKKLDAHHIDPLSSIIKRLTRDRFFDTETSKLEWLVMHPRIRDHRLKNGQTLCRNCHKSVHNWGSHHH